MRDIRHDLADRLTLLSEEMGKLTRELQLKQDEREHLRKLLELENRRFNLPVNDVSQQNLPGMNLRVLGSDSGTALTQHIKAALADREPHTLSEIAKFADKQGYPFGKKSPKRTVNFALLALKNASVIVRTKSAAGDKAWKLK